MINTQRLINSFVSLCSIDGVSGNELDIARELTSRLNQIGFVVEMDDAGKSFGGNSGNLIGRLEGNADLPPMFLCAHMDTILSTKGLNPVLKDGIIKSNGNTILGADDRSGIAAILEILNVVHEQSIPHGKIEVIFTVCEEAGMNGAKNISRSKLESHYGYIFDCQASPGNYIIEAPAAVLSKIVVKGREAHAAVSPEKGVHAIKIASKAINQLEMGRWAETGMLNIGTIQGGTAINVIPNYVEIKGEFRNAEETELLRQREHIINVFNSAADELGGKVDIEFFEKYGGYRFANNEPKIKLAKKAIADSGLTPNAIKYPGGSDANVFNNKGIPALNLGVGMKNAHSFEEMIAIDDLVKISEIGVNLIKNSSQLNNILG